MFKELKIIKLVVIASFFVYIILASFNKFNISTYFFSSGSVEMDASMNLYVASNYAEKEKELVVKDLSGNYIKSIEVNLMSNVVFDKNNDYLSIGYPVENSFVFNVDQIKKSGIYTLENSPFVVKSKEKVDITIVYPFVNNHFYTQTNDGYFFNEEKTHLSLNREMPIDKYTLGMARYFSYLDSSYSTKYITDLDLENENNFFNSKMVIIYGRSSFWTAKMRKNLLKYFNEGGNILMITSKTLDTKLWVNKEQNTARTVEVDKEQNKLNIETWGLNKKESPFNKTALTSKYGGSAVNIYRSEYSILVKEHPIFKGLAGSKIPVEGRNFMGTLIRWQDSIPIAEDLSLINNPDVSKLKVEILAYSYCKGLYENSNGGIFIIKQNNNSGKIISLGTEDWCLKKNQGKKEITSVTTNAVRYLLEEN